MHIHESEWQLAARALAFAWEHVFGAHPSESAAERFCDTEDLEVVLKLLFDLVLLDRVVSVLKHLEVFQACVVFG